MRLAQQQVTLELGPYAALARLEEDARTTTYVGVKETPAGDLELARLRTLTAGGAASTWAARFVAQSRRLQSLDTRNLVRVAAVEDEWMALEWMAGRDLRTILSRFARTQLRSVGVAHLVTDRVLDQVKRHLPTPISLYIVRELASALVVLHENGIVAGELSASAVVVGWDGSVKLDQTAVELNRPTTLKRRPPSYNVPSDARGDVWHAGIILFEMLAGRAVDRVEPRLADLFARGDVPRGLMRLFSDDPDERITSAAELRALLDTELGAIDPRLDRAAVADMMDELFDGEARRDVARVESWLEEARRRRRAPSSRTPTPRVTAERIPHASTGSGPAHAHVIVGAANPQSLLGTLIDGRYRIERLIGEGGMGWVFQVHHEQIGRRLAMKVLTPEHTGTSERMERFRREARVTSAVGHPGIVEVTDSGVTPDGNVYFVMELLKGRELGTLTARGEALAVLRALGIARQIARALAAAHRVGVVHRDLKPENVFLVERDGNPDFVKVLDFGIATAPGPRDMTPGLTRPGLIMGTPEYMAPEQALGGVADARSDIYSCASIFYELLAGSPPYPPGNPIDLLARKTVEDAIPLGELAPHVPRALQELVMKCLSRDAAARPQTMDEIVAALDRIEQAERSERTAPIGVQALLLPRANDVTRLIPVPPPAPPRAMSWLRLAMLISTVIALAVTTLAFVASNH